MRRGERSSEADTGRGRSSRLDSLDGGARVAEAGLVIAEWSGSYFLEIIISVIAKQKMVSGTLVVGI
jgi:hypothetical protein